MLVAPATCVGSAACALITAALQFFSASQSLVGERWPKSAVVKNGTHFDFIVVGAGSGGAAVAARLAQACQLRVLVVEAGGQPPVESVIPGFRDVLKNSPYDWNFTTINDGFSSQGLRYGKQLQPRGKLLGGSGSINHMVYSRGHPEDYNEWADIAGPQWNWTNVLKYFKKPEYMTDKRIVNNKKLMRFHGVKGEIEVSGRAELSYTTSKLLGGFNELGINIVDDMTYPYNIGAGRFSHTIRNGKRESSLTALLNNVRSDNLYVLNNTLVTKILIENNTAVGISAISNGEEVQFYADKEVIISAGTFNTPKLLMLSGVGPKEHLEEVGIEVVQDLPVGDNLHDHVMVINFLAIKNGTCDVETPVEYFEIVKYLYNFSGMFSYSDSMGVYLPKVGSQNRNLPQFGVYPTCMPRARLTMQGCLNVLGYDESVCTKIVSINELHELIPLPVVHLKPQSRGKVRLNSTDPNAYPLIYSGTFSNRADYEGYVEAIQSVLRLANTTYFKAQGARVVDYMWEKCAKLKKAEDRIKCQVRDYAMGVWHSVGTAAMGSVVDGQLRVRGVDRLRVVDASVMPVIPRGNTDSSVIMIAEIAARLIKNAYNSI